MVKKHTPKKPDNIIVQKIDIRVPNRNTQDISNWRMAIRAFENRLNPVRTYLYDLYEDILLDSQIEATWGKRQDAVLNKEIIFNKDGDVDKVIGKLLNSPDMRRLIKEIHNAIAWGYTLIQINNIYYDDSEESYKIDFDLIPRKHVHPERDFECVSKQQNVAEKDFLFKQPPLSNYMLSAGDDEDKGLLAKAAQYVIYKRGGFGDWSQFSEMFGMPFRECSYDDYDEETRMKLEQAMEQWGGLNYIVKPKGAEINIHDTGGSSGSNTVYKDLIAACDASIAKCIVGNTLTTEQGERGSLSLGDIHKEVENAKIESDQKFILSILNTKFRAILKRFGFDVTGGDIWYASPDADWDKMQKKWNVINGISEKIPVEDDYIYEEFDIPKPQNYEQLKEEMSFKKSLESGFNQMPTQLEKPQQPKNLLGRVLNFFV